MSGRRTPVGILMELAIMALVFAACAAVCLGLFAGAKNTGRDSRDEWNAAMWAQSAAEAYKAAGGSLSETARLLDGQYADGAVRLTFGQDWEMGGEGYLLTVSPRDEGAQAAVFREGEELFSLYVEAVTYG